MDQTETLINLGLTLNEARIYQALLDLKRGSIEAIAGKANIHRRNIYDTLKRLEDKGLVFQVLSVKTLLYSPVHPEKLQELISEKEQDLRQIMPNLVQAFDNQPIKHYSCIYRGKSGLKNYIRLMLKEGQTVYGIGSKGSWFDPRIGKFAAEAGREWREKRIESYIIYDAELKNHPEVQKAIGPNFKFLPEKYSSGSSIDIFGDYVITYSGMKPKQLDQEITIFILKDKTLAQDYLKWFWCLWDLLPIN